MVAVSDTGAGMPPDVVERAFEPFFTTKEVGKGTGLGLAQAYGFVKQSGGGIRIGTVVGEGTSIKVYLPRAEGADDATAEEPRTVDCAARHEKDGKTVILVVDGAVREVTATRLEEAGHEVREAGTGLASLASLEADPCVDLMVLDFAMPGMNGAEVATEIRKRWPGMPVLFVTGYADTAALIRGGAGRRRRHRPEAVP